MNLISKVTFHGDQGISSTARVETPEYSGLRLSREKYREKYPPGVPRGGITPLLPTNPNTSHLRDAIINSSRLPGSRIR
jgi:hypothetical protein